MMKRTQVVESVESVESVNELQLATCINVNYGRQFLLVDDKNHPFTEDEACQFILGGLEFLANKHPDDFPAERYDKSNRTYWIGVSLVKNGHLYLIPSFNGNGVPNLKYEFTNFIEQFATIVQAPKLFKSKKKQTICV